MITVASTDGVELAVHDLGGPDPDARPLLLCHATGFHGRVWRALADELPELRCLALDFRGYGDSHRARDGELELGRLRRRRAGRGRRVSTSTTRQAVGHSKGGAAILLAEEARPGTFERLACYEPIVFPPAARVARPARTRWPRSPRSAARHFDSFEDGHRQLRGQAAARLAAPRRPRGLRAPRVRRSRPTAASRLKAEPRARGQDLRDGLAATAASTDLDDVRCPVLVAHGGDAEGPAQLAPLVAAALPHGRAARLPRARALRAARGPDVVRRAGPGRSSTGSRSSPGLSDPRRTLLPWPWRSRARCRRPGCRASRRARLQFRFSAIDRLPEPPTVAATRGTLVHAALEHLFTLPAADRVPERRAGRASTQRVERLRTDPDWTGLELDAAGEATLRRRGRRPGGEATSDLEDPDHRPPRRARAEARGRGRRRAPAGHHRPARPGRRRARRHRLQDRPCPRRRLRPPA